VSSAVRLQKKEWPRRSRAIPRKTRRLHLGYIGGLLALGAVDDVEFHGLAFCK